MRKCSFLLFVLSCSPLAWSQATPSPAAPAQAPAQTPAPSAASLKPRGPEAVAASDPNKVVAIVDGKQITAKQALEMLKALTPEQRKQYESNLQNVIQQLSMQQQMAELATKMDLENQEPWKDRLVMTRQTVLAQAYLSHLNDEASKTPADDPQKYYDTHPDEYDQAKLSGIFVSFTPPGTPAPANGQPGRTEQQAEEKANEIEKKLKAGGDFAALARTDNDNSQISSNGGDLGTVSMGDPKLPPVLRTTINKLQPGQVSEPVRVGSSFLILKLESRHKQPYSEVQDAIVKKLRADKNQSLVKQEVDKYKIKVEDQDFFEAAGSRPVPSLQKPSTGTSK
jgi:parvulin-like peptidyl-prolyl isomerase